MRPRYRDLFDALLDPDPARTDAAYDAVLFDRAEALPDLAELLNTSPVPLLRFYAIQLMGFTEDKSAVPMVEKALEDPDASVRAEACRALEDLRSRGSVAVLDARLDDMDAKVRRAAREALAVLGGGRRRS